MANEAFMAGFNAKRKPKDGSDGSDSGSPKKPSGLTGLISGAIQSKGKDNKVAQATNTLKKAQGPSTTQMPTTGAFIPQQKIASFPSFKHGGRVKKTGLIYAHRGEVVIPAKMRAGKKKSGKRTITKP